MKKQPSPTPGQMMVWDALDRLTKCAPLPPSMTDLLEETGMTSTSVLKHRLDCGVRVGRVTKVPCRGGSKYVPAWYHRMIVENMDKYYKGKNA